MGRLVSGSRSMRRSVEQHGLEREHPVGVAFDRRDRITHRLELHEARRGRVDARPTACSGRRRVGVPRRRRRPAGDRSQEVAVPGRDGLQRRLDVARAPAPAPAPRDRRPSASAQAAEALEHAWRAARPWVSSRSASARPGEPSARAHAARRTLARRRRARCEEAASIVGVGSGSRRTCWQRERTVGSSSDARAATRSRTTAPGGSSSVFSSAFWPCSLSARRRRRRRPCAAP